MTASTARALAIDIVVRSTQGEPEAVRTAALAAIDPPGPDTADALWRFLVIGLLLLTLVALAAVIYLLVDGDDNTSPDIVLTAFTALLTGLLGLFVKSPAQDD